MTSDLNGVTTDGGFRTLYDAPAVRLKLGRELRASVTETPNGRPGLVLREWITPESKPVSVPITSKRIDRATWVERHADALERFGGVPDRFRGTSVLTSAQAWAAVEAMALAAGELEAAEARFDADGS